MGIGSYYNSAFMAYGNGGCLGSGYGYGFLPGMTNQSIWGAGDGYFTANLLFGFLDLGVRDWQTNRAKKAEEKQAAKDAVKTGVKDVEQKQKEYSKLQAKSIADIEAEVDKADPSLKKNIDDANTKVENIKNNKDTISTQIKALEDANSDLANKKKAETDPEKIKEIDEQIKTNNEKIRKLNADKVTAKSDAEREYEAAVEARNKAISDAKEANKQAISDKEEEIKKAQGQVEEDVGKIQSGKKCKDDNELTGVILKEGCSKKVTDELGDDDLNDVTKDNAKKYAKAFNYQFSQYCSEKDETKKKTMAANAKLVYGKLKEYENSNDKKGKYITPEMEQNMKIMESGRQTLGL